MSSAAEPSAARSHNPTHNPTRNPTDRDTHPDEHPDIDASDPSINGSPGRARARVWSIALCFAIGLLLGRWLPDQRFAHDASETLLGPLLAIISQVAAAKLAIGASLGALGVVITALVVQHSRTGRRALSFAATLIAVLLIGLGWSAFRLHTDAPRSVWHQLGPMAAESERVLVEVEMDLVTNITPGAAVPDHLGLRFTEPSSWFHADLRTVRTDQGSVDVRGRVRVYVPAGLHDESDLDSTAAPKVVPRIGDRVVAMGWLAPPTGPMNPGDPDWQLWSRQEGRAGVLSLSGLDAIHPVTRTPTLVDRLVRAPLAVRHTLQERAKRAVDAIAPSGMVRAVYSPVLLGERDPSPAEVTSSNIEFINGQPATYRDAGDTLRNAATRTGTAHFLAISGLHLALLAAMLLALIRFTGDRGWLEPALVLLGIALILLIVPSRPPVIRAGVLIAVFTLTSASGRRFDSLTILGWCAIGLLIWRPLDASSLGFQLTVGATALLIRIHPHRIDPLGAPAAWTSAKRFRDVIVQWLATNTRMCVLCAVGTVPLIATHTGIISPLAALATLILSPLFLPMLGVGYLALLLGMIHPALGDVLAPFAGVLAGVFAWLVTLLDSLPGASVRIAPTPWLWGVVATAVFAWWIVRPWRWRSRRSRVMLVLATVGTLSWLGGHIATSNRLHDSVLTRIDMLAVDNGTAVVVRSGDHAMLWDAGSLSPSKAERGITDALLALGITRLDTVLLTHANVDHINALPSVLEHIDVGEVVTTNEFLERAHADEVIGGVLAAINSVGITVRTASRGDTITVGPLRGDVLWPPGNADDSTRSPRTGVLSMNDTSLVLRLADPTSGRSLALLTGDIQRAAMAELLASDPASDPITLQSLVLELPHHGSVHTLAGPFVDAAAPEVVLQSTGVSRVGDERWDPWRTGRVWRTTATDGAITVWIMADETVRVRTHRDGRTMRVE